MSSSKKLAISLPKELVSRMEKLRKQTGETRSAFIRRAIQLVFKKLDKEARLKEYIDGYRKKPESAEEVAAAQASATQLLAQEPWE
jgi:metal-responsive CopG/Arc/MetJ family transcriptional regulator